jgi:hypothetical protein
MKIKELLTDESKWTQETLAKNENGERVSPTQSDAVCWCLVGAIYKCYSPYEQPKIYFKLSDKFKVYAKLINKFNINSIQIDNRRIDNRIGIWNDQSTRTFDDVKRLVEELDI